MKSNGYKHAASVSGQLFFCAAPIRLDSYDGCQFGCLYCFSRRRGRLWSANGIHGASVSGFAERMRRVRAGTLGSALDEFLAARVPIQLGGLHDPFTAREEQHRVSYRLLEILLRYDHPTVISTKGKLVAHDEYLSLLQEMKVFVRFSAAGVSEPLRLKVDRGCDTFPETLSKIAKLSSRGVATGLRVQPLIPGFEGHALEMTRQAAAAGAKQVSFEYLKIPFEGVRVEIPSLSEAVGFDVLGLMQKSGLRQVGWDHMLTSDAKRAFVARARTVCREVGVRFGAGDTDFIPWSDGDGCCACSGFFLSGRTPVPL